MNEYFKKAGSLEEKPKDYFDKAGSLEEKPKDYFEKVGSLEEKPNNYFEKAGSLEEKPKDYFTKPEDLSHNNNFSFKQQSKYDLNDPNSVQNYLDSISSHEKTRFEFGNMPQMMSGGRMFRTLSEVEEMINRGDNIISAKYFPNMNMVEVEFETFTKKSSNNKHI